MRFIGRQPNDVPIHEGNLEETSPLYDLIGQERLAVNSYQQKDTEFFVKSTVN